MENGDKMNYDDIGLMPPKSSKKVKIKIIKTKKGELPNRRKNYEWI